MLNKNEKEGVLLNTN